MTGILLALSQQEPSADLVKHVISRDPKEGDRFSITILSFWIRSYEKKMIEIFANQLTKSISPTKRKRQHASKGTLAPAAEQTLLHLNLIRQHAKLSNSFISADQIQAALISVQNHCTEAQKVKFSDLFALADEHEVKPSKKKAAAKKKARVEESASESDTSEVSPCLSVDRSSSRQPH